MTTSVAIYEKDGQIVQTHSSFIYEDSIYKVFKGGVSLFEEKQYSTNKPLKLKKKDFINRKKKADEYFIRFLTMEFAPESYLIKEGYTLINSK